MCLSKLFFIYSDSFFIYFPRLDSYLYKQLKEEQDLKSDFAGFQTMLIKLIQSCITDPEHFKSVIVMNSDSTANLNFFQMLEFKRLSLLEVVLQMGEEDEINAHASFRYKMKSL